MSTDTTTTETPAPEPLTEEELSELTSSALDISASEITDGDDLFQDGIAVSGSTDFDYPLTAFIPKAAPPRDSKQAPPEAGVWIVPDEQDIRIVRTVKMFELSWCKKVPPAYNILFVRTGADRYPNPTALQRAVLDTVITKYPRNDGSVPISQTIILPVVVMREGKAHPTVAELSPKVYEALKTFSADADDLTSGAVRLGTKAIFVWKEQQPDGKMSYRFKFDKNEFDRSAVLAEVKDELVDAADYVKLRAPATEKWLVEAFNKFKNGESVESEYAAPPSPEEAYIDAVMDLTTPMLKKLLYGAGVDTTELKSRQRLIDAAVEAREALQPQVLELAKAKAAEAAAKAKDAQDAQNAPEPPF